MINYVFLFLVVIGILSAVFYCFAGGVPEPAEGLLPDIPNRFSKEVWTTAPLKAVTDKAIKGAKDSVELALGLIGIMALFLGLMKIAEEAGLIKILARGVKPITRILFPKLPADHPAVGAMLMNIIANFLGLGNAATPLGLKAMEELQKINPIKDEVSDEMCTFLVINTSGWALVPTTMIGIRAATGSANPENIILPTFFACTVATLTGVITVKILQRLKIFKRNIPPDAVPEDIPVKEEKNQ